MGEDFEGMGPEEIRARMEISKIKITGAVGVGFSSLLGMTYIWFNNWGEPKGLLGIIFFTGLALLTIKKIAYPSAKEFVNHAKKIDELKKNNKKPDESHSKGGSDYMNEILKKNEIKATIERELIKD
jgi:hypothetical protein